MVIVLSDAMKERVKLRATFVNNLGVGVILVGVFTPVTRVLYDPLILASGFIVTGISMLVCFAAGFGLHFVATWLLKGLDP